MSAAFGSCRLAGEALAAADAGGWIMNPRKADPAIIPAAAISQR
jgi:hypothetical protein